MKPIEGRSSKARGLLVVMFAVLLAACATPLRRAIETGDSARVSELLDQGADRKENLAYGVTPLKIAVYARRPDVAKLLIARGADVNEHRGGPSALSAAAMNGDLAMVKLLLAHGALAAKTDAFWVRGKESAAIIALLEAALASQAQNHAQRTVASTPAVARPPVAADPRSDDFALVVGVEKYMAAPEARFAEADAQAVAGRLVALGWPARNVLTLTGDRAGRAGLARYLERWLPANAGRNGRIFFYFAGDGAVDRRSGTAYLLPWDGDPAMLEQTGYPLSRLCLELSPLGERGATIVIDAGFSGSGERSASALDGKLPGRTDVVTATAAARCALVLAAAPDRAITVLQDRKRGLLTDALLRAWAADAPASVTTKELLEGVGAYAAGLARVRGGVQEPLMRIGDEAGTAPPP